MLWFGRAEFAMEDHRRGSADGYFLVVLFYMGGSAILVVTMTAYIKNAIKHLFQATYFTCKGLYAALRSEEAFRQEVYVLVIVIPLAFWVGKTGMERGLLIGSWIIVLAVELTNSAIEAAVDRIGTERHELAGKAKDYGSAAVFCAIVAASVVWVCMVVSRFN